MNQYLVWCLEKAGNIPTWKHSMGSNGNMGKLIGFYGIHFKVVVVYHF